MNHPSTHDIWDAFEARLKELFLLCNGKTVVLWGYGYSGRFIEHVFRRHGKQVELRIDADGKKRGVERPALLGRLDPDAHIVLVTFPPGQEELAQLASHGFQKNESYVPLVEFFYGADEVRVLSYHDWLEHVTSIDIRKPEYDTNAGIKDFCYFSKGPDYSLVDVLDNFCFQEGDRIFDYGCGKGSAIVLFEKTGVSWGGIEYDRGLYEMCLQNLKMLGLPTDQVFCGDAATFSETDAYNYFYCYNAFTGETFRQMIRQLEASWRRKPRVMTFIYSNPFCHESVVANGIFRWTKKISSDFYIPDVHIYQTKAR